MVQDEKKIKRGKETKTKTGAERAEVLGAQNETKNVIETETGIGIGKGEKDVAGPETATFVNVTVNADVKETGIVKTGTGSGMDIIEMVSVSDEIEIVTVQSEGAEERTMTMIIERNV